MAAARRAVRIEFHGPCAHDEQHTDPRSTLEPRRPERRDPRAGRATALCIAGAGAPRPWGIAAGLADVAAGRALTVDTPFRTASNTKTMTAAIALRLKERGRLNLDAPIAGLLSPAHVDLLRSAGHACDAITPRQLMQHSAGLSDHADDAYVRDVLADPAHAWTRGEQLRRYTSQPAPSVRQARSSSIPTPATCCWARSSNEPPATRWPPSRAANRASTGWAWPRPGGKSQSPRRRASRRARASSWASGT